MLSSSQSDSKICLQRALARLLCKITRTILPEPSPLLSSFSSHWKSSFLNRSLYFVWPDNGCAANQGKTGRENLVWTTPDSMTKKPLLVSELLANREHLIYQSWAEKKRSQKVIKEGFPQKTETDTSTKGKLDSYDHMLAGVSFLHLFFQQRIYQSFGYTARRSSFCNTKQDISRPQTISCRTLPLFSPMS